MTGQPENTASRADPPAKAKRAQVAKACQRCKRLQKRCSESRPCQRCASVGLEEQCLQHDGKTRQSPESAGHASPPATYTRQRGLPPAPVIGYCFRRFFAKLYPTIPILSPEYAEMVLAEAESDHGEETRCLTVAVCAVVLIQVEEPHQHLFEAEGIQHSNRELGKLLFKEAMAAHHDLSWNFNPCLERALATFFLYACHASLFHHSQAFYFLRQTGTLWLVLRIEEVDTLRRKLAGRLFWVIMVSERSHGVRYRRPITLQVASSAPGFDGEQDPGLTGLRALVALFRPLDTAFFALLNQEEMAAYGDNLGPALDSIQSDISSALGQKETRGLCETQLANLRVTQLWLMIILWQLRLRLGMLVEQVDVPCHLTFHHPVEVGQQLVGAIQAMSLESIRIHGAGITEKIFDIACAMADVLSRVPLMDSRGAGLNNIRYLRHLIHQLPGGASTYDPLLDKHIRNTLPDLPDSPSQSACSP